MKNIGKVEYFDEDGGADEQREIIGGLIGKLEGLQNRFNYIAIEYDMAQKEREEFARIIQIEINTWAKMFWALAKRYGLGESEIIDIIKELYVKCRQEAEKEVDDQCEGEK